MHGNEGTTKIYHKTRDIVYLWALFGFPSLSEGGIFLHSTHPLQIFKGTFLSPFLFSPFGYNTSHVFWISAYSIMIDRSKRWAGSRGVSQLHHECVTKALSALFPLGSAILRDFACFTFCFQISITLLYKAVMMTAAPHVWFEPSSFLL